MLRIFSFLPPPDLPSEEAWSLRSEQAASRSCLLISDNGKQIHGIKLQLSHYQYVLSLTCSFRTLRDARKALVIFVSSYLSAFYKKQVLQHLPLPHCENLSPTCASPRYSRPSTLPTAAASTGRASSTSTSSSTATALSIPRIKNPSSPNRGEGLCEASAQADSIGT